MARQIVDRIRSSSLTTLLRQMAEGLLRQAESRLHATLFAGSRQRVQIAGAELVVSALKTLISLWVDEFLVEALEISLQGLAIVWVSSL